MDERKRRKKWGARLDEDWKWPKVWRGEDSSRTRALILITYFQIWKHLYNTLAKKYGSFAAVLDIIALSNKRVAIFPMSQD